MCIQLTVWVLVHLCAKELKPLDTDQSSLSFNRLVS